MNRAAIFFIRLSARLSCSALCRVVACLMLAALPLHALALQCDLRCALAKEAMQTPMDMTDHDCHEAVKDCPSATQCAAAHAVALLPPAIERFTSGNHPVTAQPAFAVRSHTPLPPERPPRLA